MPNAKPETDPPEKKPRKQRTSQKKVDVPEPPHKEERFDPNILDKMVITLPLMKILQEDPEDKVHSIIIDLNLDYPDGRNGAREQVTKLLNNIIPPGDQTQGIKEAMSATRKEVDEEVAKQLK